MGANQLVVQPVFRSRARHYRDRMAKEGRPQVADRFVAAVQELVGKLIQNPKRGHPAGFETIDLADVLRATIPGFRIFAIFYRWNGQRLTIISLEHTAQDLPARLASIVSTPAGDD